MSFSDADIAGFYDVLNPWGGRDDQFYLALVMSASAVLDVGCGTGTLLHRARDAGHGGRLCGLDPDPAMLGRARRRRNIDWVQGDAASAAWDQEFDLIVMTGHAFQVLVSDDELRASLAALHAALADGGRFAFETRHPQARAWENWTPANATEFADASGGVVRVEHRVEAVSGDAVQLTETHASAGKPPRVDRALLRFLDVAPLAAFLGDAQFVVDEQFGDWDGSPLTESSPEIITIARRAQGSAPVVSP